MYSETRWFISGCLIIGLLALATVWIWSEQRGHLAQQNLELGNALLRAGEKEIALQSFQHALRSNSKLAEAHYGRARILLRRGDAAATLDAATKALELGLELGPELGLQQGTLYRIRADAKFSLGQREAALLDYGRALEQSPKDALNYEKRGSALLLLKRPQEALQDYDQALRYNPYSAELYYNRALIHRKLGNDAAARRDASIAQELGLR